MVPVTMNVRSLVVPALLLAACSTPGMGDPAYERGTLNNGGFLFSCDDSVACSRWNDNAKEFPTMITTGSNFDLTYVASEDQGDVLVNPEYPGMTLEAVSPYMGQGPDGFAALRPGYGTVVAHDREGRVIDYVTLHIVKPDALVVYDAAYKGLDPVPIDALTLVAEDRKQFRTVGETNHEASAGSIRVEWVSDDPAVVKVESYKSGVVTLRAVAAGKATITASGAALEKTIPVEVK